ncbi:MAG: hypothetical protein HC851_21405 [Acaryochloris sp. RU_4_1]|nr:hypothetical protein [Acaryochloris sp. SU_5_25]NJM68036.1 hypothetical protein [Acaryochloris sp. RU_4_1]NJR56769.1 hypothetical protein [Acaryochloris sp. CRU_2_0]
MEVRPYKYWHLFRAENPQRGFTQVELLYFIVIAGILPTAITSILTFNHNFGSVVPTSRSFSEPVVTLDFSPILKAISGNLFDKDVRIQVFGD